MHPACITSAFSDTFTSTSWQISFLDKQTHRQTHKTTTVSLAHARRGLTTVTLAHTNQQLAPLYHCLKWGHAILPSYTALLHQYPIQISVGLSVCLSAKNVIHFRVRLKEQLPRELWRLVNELDTMVLVMLCQLHHWHYHPKLATCSSYAWTTRKLHKTGH